MPQPLIEVNQQPVRGVARTATLFTKNSILGYTSNIIAKYNTFSDDVRSYLFFDSEENSLLNHSNKINIYAYDQLPIESVDADVINPIIGSLSDNIIVDTYIATGGFLGSTIGLPSRTFPHLNSIPVALTNVLYRTKETTIKATAQTDAGTAGGGPPPAGSFPGVNYTPGSNIVIIWFKAGSELGTPNDFWYSLAISTGGWALKRWHPIFGISPIEELNIPSTEESSSIVASGPLLDPVTGLPLPSALDPNLGLGDHPEKIFIVRADSFDIFEVDLTTGSTKSTNHSFYGVWAKT